MGPQWAKKGYSELDPGLVFWSTTAISPRILNEKKDANDSKNAVEVDNDKETKDDLPLSVPGATCGEWTYKAFPRLAKMPDGAAVKCLFGTQILKGIRDGSMYPGEGPPPTMQMTSVSL